MGPSGRIALIVGIFVAGALVMGHYHLAGMVAGIAAAAILIRRYVRDEASPDKDDARDLRSLDLFTDVDPSTAVARLQQLSSRSRLRIRSVDEDTERGLLFETPPGFLVSSLYIPYFTNGFFFPVRVDPASGGRTHVTVGCRPRVPLYLWHLGVRRMHEQMYRDVAHTVSGEPAPDASEVGRMPW